jgi:uncharacterized protein YjbJ (UPF0337 family)
MADDPKTSGKWDQQKGKVREAFGDLTGNKEQQRKGQVEQASGKAKEVVGRVEEAAKDVLKKDEDLLNQDKNR